MSEVNIPFRPDSRSYKIMDLALNKNMPYPEIQKKLGIDKVSKIYDTVATYNKKIKAVKKPPRTMFKPPLSSSSQPPLTDNNGERLEVVEASQVEILPPSSSTLMPPRSGGNVVHVEGFAPGKMIALTPPNITLIQWFMAKYDYKGDLSDFINDAIEDFFKARNRVVKVVEEIIVR